MEIPLDYVIQSNWLDMPEPVCRDQWFDGWRCIIVLWWYLSTRYSSLVGEYTRNTWYDSYADDNKISVTILAFVFGMDCIRLFLFAKSRIWHILGFQKDAWEVRMSTAKKWGLYSNEKKQKIFRIVYHVMTCENCVDTVAANCWVTHSSSACISVSFRAFHIMYVCSERYMFIVLVPLSHTSSPFINIRTSLINALGEDT